MREVRVRFLCVVGVVLVETVSELLNRGITSTVVSKACLELITLVVSVKYPQSEACLESAASVKPPYAWASVSVVI